MNTHTDRHDAARGGLNPDRLAAIPAQMQRFIDDGDRSGIVTLVWRRGAIARLDVDAQRQVLTLKLAAPVATSSMPKPFTVARDGFSLNAAVACVPYQPMALHRQPVGAAEARIREGGSVARVDLSHALTRKPYRDRLAEFSCRRLK
jgi:hypothetical protein